MIVPGATITLVSTLAPTRVFTLHIRTFEPPSTLVWGDKQGERTYRIEPREGGVTFTMTERIGGMLFPLYGRFIPSFDASFERYAADLKRAAEARASAR